MNNVENLNWVKTNSMDLGYNSFKNIQYSDNSNFSQESQHNTSVTSIKNDNIVEVKAFYLVKNNIPLRPKIDQIKYRINSEIIKFQKIFKELKNQDEEVVRNLVLSLKENNVQYASLVSSELNKIRKTSKMIWSSKLVLDILQKEINNISNFKDLVEIFPSTLTAIKSVRSMLFSHLSESDHDLRNIADLLIDVLITVGQMGGYLINFKLANNKALTILNDAKFEAEDKIKKEFLPIPDAKL